MREEDTVCVGSDGLRYCKVCGEAKEAFFPKGGFMGMKKHSRQCACDRKAYEEEQKYFKDKPRMNNIFFDFFKSCIGFFTHVFCHETNKLFGNK